MVGLCTRGLFLGGGGGAYSRRFTLVRHDAFVRRPRIIRGMSFFASSCSRLVLRTNGAATEINTGTTRNTFSFFQACSLLTKIS